MTLTGDLYMRLEHRFALPEWALFQQVRDGAGLAGVRTADAIAMNLWPSRGLTLHGFEIKTSRGDWLRELKDPSKAEAVARFCDYWWIVVPDAEIVGDDLPPAWGLLVPSPRGKGLRNVVAAPQTEAAEITRSFLGAILRRAHAVTPDRVRVEEAYGRGREQGGESATLEIERLKASRDSYRDRVREADRQWQGLEELLGMSVGSWTPQDRVLAAIQFALTADPDRQIAQARRIGDELRRLVETFEETLAGLQD